MQRKEKRSHKKKLQTKGKKGTTSIGRKQGRKVGPVGKTRKNISR